jgi:hypothetical protein
MAASLFVAACGGSAATQRTGGGRNLTVAKLAAQTSQVGLSTLGLGQDGWHVQSTAPSTDWTNDTGAT